MVERRDPVPRAPRVPEAGTGAKGQLMFIIWHNGEMYEDRRVEVIDAGDRGGELLELLLRGERAGMGRVLATTETLWPRGDFAPMTPEALARDVDHRHAEGCSGWDYETPCTCWTGALRAAFQVDTSREHL